MLTVCAVIATGLASMGGAALIAACMEKLSHPRKFQSTSATIWRNAEYPIARLRSKRKKKER